MTLQEKLEKVLADKPGTFGVAVRHLGTGESAAINGDVLFQTASSCKVAILAALFHEAEKGRLSLETRIRLSKSDLVPGSGVFQYFDVGAEISVKDLATLMIIVSDNLATDKILEMVGKDNVNALTRALGLKNSRIEHTIWELLCAYVGMASEPKNEARYKELEERLEDPVDRSDSSIFDMDRPNNVSTPEEMNRLLVLLAEGRLVSKAASAAMIDILKKQQFGHRLPYLLPDGATVAHKTGTIGSVVNDVGIVYFPNQSEGFAISVFSRGCETAREAEQTIAELAKTAYDHFAAAKL
jgi:beta-lactamase class A